MPEKQHIVGARKVIEALGYWPTFHDAEVISSSVERGFPFKSGHAVARLAVHVRQYETVGEGTAECHQVVRKSVLVRFVFHGACELKLSDFNHQNVINAITISKQVGDEESRLLVDVESIWGFGGTLQCVSASVEAVEIQSIVEA